MAAAPKRKPIAPAKTAVAAAPPKPVPTPMAQRPQGTGMAATPTTATTGTAQAKTKAKAKAKGKANPKTKVANPPPEGSVMPGQEGEAAVAKTGKAKIKKRKVGFRRTLMLIKASEAKEFMAANPKLGITKISIHPIALAALQSMARELIDRFAVAAQSYMEVSKKDTLTKRDLTFTANSLLVPYLDPDFHRNALASGNDAVARYVATRPPKPPKVATDAKTDVKSSEEKVAKPKTRNPEGNRTSRARTFFAIPRIEKELRRHKFSRISEEALVFLCGLLDYVFSCTILTTIEAMVQSKNARIFSRHIMLALSQDAVLKKVFPSRVRKSGVIQNIQPALYSGKKREYINQLAMEALSSHMS